MFYLLISNFEWIFADRVGVPSSYLRNRVGDVIFTAPPSSPHLSFLVYYVSIWKLIWLLSAGQNIPFLRDSFANPTFSACGRLSTCRLARSRPGSCSLHPLILIHTKLTRPLHQCGNQIGNIFKRCYHLTSLITI